MSAIHPPEYQQSPPEPPPLPPHRRWPRRHKILTALGSGFGLLVALIIVIAATSAPSVTKPSPRATTAAAPATSAQATTTPTPVAPSLTAAQQKFITDMSSQYNLGDGTTSGNAAVVTVGNDVCTMLKSGASESSIASVVQQSQSGMSASFAAGVVSLAGRDLCPQNAAQAKAAAARAAAAAKAAAAKAAAARAAKIAAENTPISAAQWGRVIRNPSAYTGNIYTISGTVTQYDINSNTIATVESAALVAVDANGNQFIVEANQSLLGNVQSGQTFTAKVKVLGAVGVQSTTGGGTGQAPDFDASTFTVTG
ncbi:MAG TPA: DUF732 domain-containing protein [Gemmataceae bacterium]|jgi:hypothetical protein|nr:DUF732 domain-containing protein [Gemmataceae bacterium]